MIAFKLNHLWLTRRTVIMSKKKKHPVKRMTETDYENYIMSLKDEKPVKAVVPKEEE